MLVNRFFGYIIPKEIRRTLRMREGDPLQTTLTDFWNYFIMLMQVGERLGVITNLREIKGYREDFFKKYSSIT